MFSKRKRSHKTAYDFEFTSIKSGTMPLSEYKGKVILVVNTASKCGFTKQYAGLQKLWEAYKKRGLVIIGVPSNDFGTQEPGTNSEIKKFCRKNYSIDFPMTSKEILRGKYAHPFYVWATKTLGNHAAPRWNFYKYLISPEGEVVDFFTPFTKPMSKKLINSIEKQLTF